MLNKVLGKAQSIIVTKPLAYGDEGDNGKDGNDGKDGDNVNNILQNPEVQQAVQAKIDAEVEGLKNKNAELINKFKRFKVEPEEVEKLIETSKQFEGLDVERLKTLQKQMDENEEMRLLSEGKTEEVVQRRVELLKKDYQQQIDVRDSELEKYKGTIKQKDEKLRELIVDGTVRQSYAFLDLEPTAMEDILHIAREVFILGEDGKVVPRDLNGNIIFGKDGKTPIDAKGWLETQAEKKPYLRRASKGAGATGNRTGVNSDATTSVGKIANGLREMGM